MFLNLRFTHFVEDVWNKTLSHFVSGKTQAGLPVVLDRIAQSNLFLAKQLPCTLENQEQLVLFNGLDPNKQVSVNICLLWTTQ